MLEHAQNPNYTAKDYLAHVSRRESSRELEAEVRAERTARAVELDSEGLSLREIGRRIGVSHISVRNYLKAAESATVPPSSMLEQRPVKA